MQGGVNFGQPLLSGLDDSDGKARSVTESGSGIILNSSLDLYISMSYESIHESK